MSSSVSKKVSAKNDSTGKKYIFFFGEADSDKNILGGKGAGLNEMTKIGIPVTMGFKIITDDCKEFLRRKYV